MGNLISNSGPAVNPTYQYAINFETGELDLIVLRSAQYDWEELPHRTLGDAAKDIPNIVRAAIINRRRIIKFHQEELLYKTKALNDEIALLKKLAKKRKIKLRR